jgi:hypothetical protein
MVKAEARSSADISFSWSWDWRSRTHLRKLRQLVKVQDTSLEGQAFPGTVFQGSHPPLGHVIQPVQGGDLVRGDILLCHVDVDKPVAVFVRQGVGDKTRYAVESVVADLVKGVAAGRVREMDRGNLDTGFHKGRFVLKGGYAALSWGIAQRADLGAPEVDVHYACPGLSAHSSSPHRKLPSDFCLSRTRLAVCWVLVLKGL